MSRSEGQTRDAIETQAAAYLAASLNDPDPATRLTIIDWIERDPRHAVAYAQAEAAWEAGERLKGQDLSAPHPPRAASAAHGFTRRHVIAGQRTVSRVAM